MKLWAIALCLFVILWIIGMFVAAAKLDKIERERKKEADPLRKG